MSFLTSFCDFPQKEQVRLVWLLSRLSATMIESYREGRLLVLRSGFLLDDDLVHQAVFLGLTWAHEVVALGIVLDAIDGLASMFGPETVQRVTHAENFLRMYVDVGRLALIPAERLVDHDARVRQRPPLALGPGGQQERTHRRGLPHADGGDVAADVLHGVVDRQSGG